MYGYIYQTTNKINNKKYIGKHHCDHFDESYIGSGKILRLAIDKYGIENFDCEIIDKADSLDELNKKEIYWIKKLNAQQSNEFYNICKGGEYVPGGPMFKGHKHSEETKKKMSEKRQGFNNGNYGNHWSQSKELKELHSNLSSGENNGMYGKHHSEETKKKTSESKKGKPSWNKGMTGKNSHMYGKY